MATKTKEPSFQARIAGILFADVRGFSKLGERQLSSFIPLLLRIYQKHLDILPKESLLCKNTWGDGLLVVCDDARRLLEYAMKLRDEMRTTDWSRDGLPADLKCRIALHFGTVSYGNDPFLRQLNCFGPELSVCARIEPVVNPGDVYCTKEFSAVTSEHMLNLKFESLGEVDLAKNFGSRYLFRVHTDAEHPFTVPESGYLVTIERSGFGLLQEKIVAELRSPGPAMDVLISAYTLHFMKQVLVGVLRDETASGHRIGKLFVKKMSEHKIAQLREIGLLADNFQRELEVNLASLAAEASKHQIPMRVLDWKDMPEFHGSIMGEKAFIGRWQVGDDGFMSGNTPVVAFNRERDPMRFERYRTTIMDGF